MEGYIQGGEGLRLKKKKILASISAQTKIPKIKIYFFYLQGLFEKKKDSAVLLGFKDSTTLNPQNLIKIAREQFSRKSILQIFHMRFNFN